MNDAALIDALNLTLGIVFPAKDAPIALNSQGMATISFPAGGDSPVEVTLQLDAPSEGLLLSAPLLNADTTDAALLARALELSAFQTVARGHWIALNRNRAQFELCSYLPANRHASDDLAQALADFIAEARRSRAALMARPTDDMTRSHALHHDEFVLRG